MRALMRNSCDASGPRLGAAASAAPHSCIPSFCIASAAAALFTAALGEYTGAMNEIAESSSWLSTRLEGLFRMALTRAYETSRVHPDAFLTHLQQAHGVGVESYDGLFSMPVDELDSIARQTVRGAMKMAGAEGAGFGMGGLATLLPDMGILSVLPLRTIQKR